MASSDDGPSKAMLSAALGGLLSLGTSGGCVLQPLGGEPGASGETSSTTVSSGGSTSTTGGSGGSSSSVASSTVASTVSSSVSSSTSTASTSIASTSAGSTSAGSTSTGSTGTGSSNPHTPIPDTACSTGIVPNPQVLSSTVGAITQTDFQSLCNQAGGIFEIQPLCGGSNACRGFAYDSGTQTYTEHSCQHTNTCAGYNCVVCG